MAAQVKQRSRAPLEKQTDNLSQFLLDSIQIHIIHVTEMRLHMEGLISLSFVSI